MNTIHYHVEENYITIFSSFSANFPPHYHIILAINCVHASNWFTHLQQTWQTVVKVTILFLLCGIQFLGGMFVMYKGGASWRFVCMYLSLMKVRPPPTFCLISCLGSTFTEMRAQSGVRFVLSLRSTASSAIHIWGKELRAYFTECYYIQVIVYIDGRS